MAGADVAGGTRILTDPDVEDLSEAILRALGAASMCWSDAYQRDSEFDSARCAAIGEELIAWVEARTVAVVTAEDDLEMVAGLTVWTEHLSMQVRDNEVALYVKPGTPRSSEEYEPWLLGKDEARRVRDLLNVATARGEL